MRSIIYRIPSGTPLGVINAVAVAIENHTGRDIVVNAAKDRPIELTISVSDDSGDTDWFHLGTILGIALGLSLAGDSVDVINAQLKAHETAR